MGKGQVGGRAGIPTQLSPVSDPEHLTTVYLKVTLSSKYTVLLLFIL